MTRGDGTHISWKRWWVPVDSEISDATGFLDDPDGPYAEYLDYPTTALCDLASVPCLVLLGEAGMGKTTELRAEVDRATGTATPALYVDLGDEPDLRSLRRTLETDPVFDNWMRGDGPLTLWLDSFDEATITIKKLVGGLTRLLQELPVGRLKLRLASRSSAWSNRLDQELDQRFQTMERLTLCPLTYSNAADAAQAAGVNPEQFLAQVAAQDLGVLAARPLTLSMLVRLAKVGPLPPGRNQLYRESATLLARENSGRRQEEQTAELPVQQRLNLARRLAVLTLLTGRPTMRTRRTPDTPASTVTIDEVAADATELADLDELLQSGLFTAAADGAVQFTHRSLAEFLAGEFLAAMPLKTTTHLLVDPLQPERVVPQLAGTSVWVATLDVDMYRWLASAEPELLLTANLADASEEQRRILGRAVLRDLDGPVPPRDRRYTWLSYGGLAADVAPYLADDRESWVKVEAAHVLSHSGCQDLDERLVELIEGIAQRNPPDYLGEDTRLATSLVYALHATERRDLLNRLSDVASQDDTPIHLRAEILGELWGRLPATVLLPILSGLDAVDAESPIADAVATLFAAAIEDNRVALNSAIDWIDSAGLSAVDQDDACSYGCSEEWHSVVVAAAVKAVEGKGAIDDGHSTILVRALYAWYAVTHSFLPDRHFHRQWVLTADGRRRLVALMLPGLTGRAAAYHLWQAGLILTEDLEWLLRRWGPDAADADKARNLGMLTYWLVDPTDTEQEQLARSVAADYPALIPMIDELYAPDRAAELTAERASAEARAARDEARAAADDFQLDTLTEAIGRSDWRTIARQMTSPLGKRQYALGALPTDAPAWKHLDTSIRTRVVEQAVVHLQQTPAAFGSSRPVDVGFAYMLVHTEQPKAIGTLDPDTVLAWLDVIRQEPAQDRTIEAMIADLADTRHQQLEQVLVRAISEDATQSYPRQTRMLGSFTTPAVETALYDLATHRDAAGHVVQRAVAALTIRDLDRGVRAAWLVILRRPSNRPPGDSRAWRQAVHACAALVDSPGAGTQFDRILYQLDHSPDFAYDVVAQTSDGARYGPSFTALTSDQLATLYLWADRNLPREPEHPPGTVISVNPVYDFPNSIFNRLAARGDVDAVAAIERIANELDKPWPRRTAADLSRQIRENSWTPLSLQAVDAILADPNRRVVTSESQLVCVLLDAIDDVAERIASNPDIASTFWDKQAGKPTVWRPVGETTFTTRFVERLQARLDHLILRQESQLNLHVGDTAGSFPDIEAVALHNDTEVSVFGEAKGNWHPELLTAITTQLADRYLTGARTSTGVYLVAHFVSDKWDPQDYRRTLASARGRQEVQQELEETARTLSNDGKTVHIRVIPIVI